MHSMSRIIVQKYPETLYKQYVLTEGGRKVLSMQNFHEVPILVDERMFHLIVKILGNFYFQLNTIFPRYSFTYIF